MKTTASVLVALTLITAMTGCASQTTSNAYNGGGGSSTSNSSSTGSEDGDATEDVGNPHGEDYGDEEVLPQATTAKEAVAYTLLFYCTSEPDVADDPSSWILMSAPVSPPIEGYWDVYAVSTSGMVTMRVTPDLEARTATLTAADSGGEGALAEWGCPSVMNLEFTE